MNKFRRFPPQYLYRLQYANMEGKAWEIWSSVVMSGRQRIDTPETVIILT